MTTKRDSSDSPGTVDELWSIDLDLLQMKRASRRIRGQLDGASVELDPNALAQLNTDARFDHLQIHPASSEFTDRVHDRSSHESRFRQRLVELFIIGLAAVVGCGLLLSIRPLVELGLAAGSLALCGYLFISITESLANTD